jgi:branched-chain amino acid transport system substrate-binding protein
MRRLPQLRSVPWALAVLAVLAVAAAQAGATTAAPRPIRIAVLSDCKGPYRTGYELDVGGAQAAFYRYAGARPRDRYRPSAGMVGGSIAGRPVELLYGCGDTTITTALTETRRLLEQRGADLMIGPLSGDEAVAIARYAKAHPRKTFVIGTAASQEPTLQIAPKNLFRYHGDGAQWNAGLGEIVYRKLGWRRAALVGDDYSFGWTAAAGIVADFCAVGGRIVTRVFPPLNTPDYSPYIRALPPPDRVDGYFWAVGGTGADAALGAFEHRYGRIKPSQHAGLLFFARRLAPHLIGAYSGGFGGAPGLKTKQAQAYEALMARWHPALPAADGFTYNYYNAAWATIRALRSTGGRAGLELQRAMPRTNRSAYEVSDGGLVKLDRNRQAIQDQYPLRIVADVHGRPTLAVVALVPNVDQSFAGLFTKSSPPPGRTQPPCKTRGLPWQGKIRLVKKGVITRSLLR